MHVISLLFMDSSNCMLLCGLCILSVRGKKGIYFVYKDCILEKFLNMGIVNVEKL